MARKIYYRYDAATDCYVKVKLSQWDRVWNIAKTVFEILGVALFVCLVLLDRSSERKNAQGGK